MRDVDVLVVGAGPAGLTLAQILHASGISCIVLERDTALASRNQGWAIALTGYVIKALYIRKPAETRLALCPE